MVNKLIKYHALVIRSINETDLEFPYVWYI